MNDQATFALIPGVTRALKVTIMVNGRETVDEFLIDLPILDPAEGERWHAHVSLSSSRAFIRRWEFQRTWLGRLLHLGRWPR